MAGKMARGMRPDEIRTFFRNADIPMVLRSNRPFKDLLAASKRGPVFYAIRYGTAPRRPGMMDLGNGFARPMKRGATQKGDGDMRHAVVMFGFREVVRADGSIRRDVFRKDPDHGSSVRPERPPYDVITGRQARAEYEAYRDVLGNTLSAAWTRKNAPEPPFKAKVMVPSPRAAQGLCRGCGGRRRSTPTTTSIRMTRSSRCPATTIPTMTAISTTSRTTTRSTCRTSWTTISRTTRSRLGRTTTRRPASRRRNGPAERRRTAQTRRRAGPRPPGVG